MSRNATDPSTTEVDHSLIAKIVSSYVRKNQISSADMPALVNAVYQSLLSLLKPHPSGADPTIGYPSALSRWEEP